MAEAFVEEDGGGGRGVEGFDLAFEGDVDASVGGVDDVFGEAGAFVADEKGDGLAPIDFPGSGEGVRGVVGVHAGGDGGDVVELELGEEDAESGSGDDGEMKSGSGGGAERFGREGAGGAGLSGGSGDCSGGSESSGGAEDGANVAGVLNAGEDDEKRGAFARGSDEKIFELDGARDDEGSDALGMFGVGDAFEETVGGGEDGDGEFGAVNERGKVGVVALAGFAEEDGFDFAAGGEGFFDEAEPFDADGAGFGGEAPAKGHAEELEPAVVAGGDGGGGGFGSGRHRFGSTVYSLQLTVGS